MGQDEIERRLDRVTRRTTPIVPRVQKIGPANLKGWDAETIKRLLFAEHLLKTGRIRS